MFLPRPGRPPARDQRGALIDDPKRIVRDGYDRLDGAYAAWVSEAAGAFRASFLTAILERTPPGARVLELGCGPGTDAEALSTGRRYTGIDLSSVQLARATRRAPTGTFVHGDFTLAHFPHGAFDAVVALYCFNHVPQAEIGPTFELVFDWLAPGGRFFASLGAGESKDGEQQDWLGEVPMFFAGFPPGRNESLLEQAGFVLESSELVTEAEPGEGEVTFHWVVAAKP
jgi:SAM-dependent methyltransferase